ncbi:MAG: serine aminopeptidase domain-containing protein [Acidimicrobiales bacterium]
MTEPLPLNTQRLATTMQGLAVPTWFEDRGTPLFGWLHRPPDENTRATIVICPPVGREHDASYEALRTLADQLAGAGFAALRFDYCGTGDSGDQGTYTDLIESWLWSIKAAIRFASDAGEQRIALLGLRIGATLAARVASELGRFEALVLWDPCASGSTFLREQYLLQRLTVRAIGGAQAPPDWTEIPGACFSPETSARLTALELPDQIDTTMPTMVLTRVDEAPTPLLEQLISNPLVTHLEVPGQRQLLETAPSGAVFSQATLGTITSFLSDTLPTDAHSLAPDDRPFAVVGKTPDERPVVERAISIGANRLFGMLTEAGGESRLTVVFLNPFFEHHIGPSRQWVELARSWACRGIRALRFDLRGIGDSLAASERPSLYAPEFVEDAVSAALELSPDAPEAVTFVGLCSGAWVAAMAAGTLGAQTVHLVNQIYWNTVRLTGDESSKEPASGDPVALLTWLSDRHVDTTLILSAEDHESLSVAAGENGMRALSVLGSSGEGARLQVIRMDELDHNMLSFSGREALAERLTPLVTERRSR